MSSNARRDGVSCIQSSFKNNKNISPPILPATTVTTSSLSSEKPKADNLLDLDGSDGVRKNDNKTFIENNNKRLKLQEGYNEVVEFDSSESSVCDNDDEDYHVEGQQNGYCSDTSDSNVLDDGDGEGIDNNPIYNVDDDSDDSEDNEEENKSNIFINISTDSESGADENIEEIVIKADDKGTKANGTGGGGNNNEDNSNGKYINWFIPPSPPPATEIQEKPSEPVVCINLEEEEKEKLRKKDEGLVAIIKANKNRMICNVCDIIFKKKNLYVHHIDRHFSDDHFKCPYCFRGYTKLTLCQAHELVDHKESLSIPIVPKTLDEDFDLSVVASTALYPYRGPPVKFQQDAYIVESEHGRNKKSYAAIVANYANHVRRCRKPQYESPTKKKANGESDTDFEGDDDTSHNNSTAPRSRPTVLTVFMCSLCGFGNPKEEELRNHQLRKHPNIPLSKLLQTFKVGSASASTAPENKSSPVSKIVPIPKVPLIQPPKLEVIENMKLEIMKNKRIRRMNKNERKIEFLFKLGLVPSQKFYSIQGIPRGFTNNSVKLYDCSKLKNKSHFLMCLICNSKKNDYFALNKAEMEQHRLANHPDKIYGDIVKLFLRGNVGEDDWGMSAPEPRQQPDYFSFLGKLSPRKRKTQNYYNNYPSDDSSKSSSVHNKRSYVKQNKKHQQPKKKTKRKKKKLKTTAGNRKSKGDLTSSGSDFY